MDRIKNAVFANPWTTLVSLGAIAALAIWGKVLTPAQVVNFTLTAILGIVAKDSGKAGE